MLVCSDSTHIGASCCSIVLSASNLQISKLSCTVLDLKLLFLLGHDTQRCLDDTSLSYCEEMDEGSKRADGRGGA